MFKCNVPDYYDRIGFISCLYLFTPGLGVWLFLVWICFYFPLWIWVAAGTLTPVPEAGGETEAGEETPGGGDFDFLSQLDLEPAGDGLLELPTGDETAGLSAFEDFPSDQFLGV